MDPREIERNILLMIAAKALNVAISCCMFDTNARKLDNLFATIPDDLFDEICELSVIYENIR